VADCAKAGTAHVNKAASTAGSNAMRFKCNMIKSNFIGSNLITSSPRKGTGSGMYRSPQTSGK
jgi:hypothetical protein